MASNGSNQGDSGIEAVTTPSSGLFTHSGPEKLKKSSPKKKLVKSNKSISRKKVFDKNPFFCNF